MTLRERGYLLEYRNRGVHVDVRELPDSLQRALKAIGYKRRDINVEPATTVDMGDAGSKGRRALSLAVNLQTGQRSDLARGSWGGPNMNSNRGVPMDNLRAPDYKIPPNGAVIKGSDGYKGTWATIYVHPSNMINLLPGDDNLNERQKTILNVMCSYTSKGRKEEWVRGKVQEHEFEELIKGGYIKRNKAGAMTATTKGKNVKGGKDNFWNF